MDKTTAEGVFEALASIENAVDILSSSLSSVSGEDEKKLKRELLDLYQGHFGFSLFVANRYPELDPDKAGKEKYELMKSEHMRRSKFGEFRSFGEDDGYGI